MSRTRRAVGPLFGPSVATLPAKSMSNKSIPKLVIPTIGGSLFAVIDTRDGNHIIKGGFKTWEQAREFVEAFYLEQGVILPREASAPPTATSHHVRAIRQAFLSAEMAVNG
jgi:hypothetical protein